MEHGFELQAKTRIRASDFYWINDELVFKPLNVYVGTVAENIIILMPSEQENVMKCTTETGIWKSPHKMS